MNFRWSFDWKLIPKYLVILAKLLLKKIFLVIFWIFYIVLFILAWIAQHWSIVIFQITSVVIFYLVKYLKAKTKELKKDKGETG
ncbi:hypothetical protein PRV_01825 [Mycoplasma parvum str. Indiana]|uniref:Uncharacterized protein n=1 Tax=Mycoplasma parvum str. Indiana TaxID=1403316 RepID=U5NC07_9MOLU|nr:hypothetical protein PRV_01825 [Mycoplasma parvum str. Indiana]